jgi:hypothetical protein
MNDPGLALCWSAVQVTLLALAAAGIYVVVCRRGPSAAAPVAVAGLVGAIILTLLAICPIFPRPSWRNDTPEPLAGDELSAQVPVAGTSSAWSSETAAGGSLVGVGDWLWQWLRRLDAIAAVPVAGRSVWYRPCGFLVLAGAALGLARLLLGLWAIRACRRRSRVIGDSALLGLVASLRDEIGSCPPVELRELPDLGAPATAGWLRPVVLLPAGWRAWDEQELRVTLAHELAHVRRRDYLASLAARLGVALHFYHPLLHWLAGRLHLQQELAADAMAARCAGGRRLYLESLARLALRGESLTTLGPAAGLLSQTETLLRRIDMLRSKQKVIGAERGRCTRWLALAVLAIAGVGVAALPSPAQKDKGGKEVAEAGQGAAKRPEPFELSYLAPETANVVAFRPAALLGRLGEAAASGPALRLTMESGLRLLGVQGKLRLGPGDVEQLITWADFKFEPQQKEHPHSIVLALHTVRCVKDFDWKGQMKEFFPAAEEIHHSGGVYYKQPKGEKSSGTLSGVCWYIPDGRTLVMDGEDKLRRLLERTGKNGPQFAWEDSWRQVECGLCAAVLDNRSGKLKAMLEDPKDPVEKAVCSMMANVSWLVVGAGGEENGWIEGVMRCSAPEAAGKVAGTVVDLLRQGRENLNAQGRKPSEKGQAEMEGFVRRLLASAKLQRDATEVRLHCEAAGGFGEVLKNLFPLPAEMDAVPAGK